MLADLSSLFQFAAWPDAPLLPLRAAIALIAAALLGEAVRRGLGLPRTVGYSLVGLAIGVSGFGGITPVTRTVLDLALALLLFELGSRLRLAWLRANPALVLTSLVEAGGSAVAIYFCLQWLGLPQDAALICAVLGSCASAAVVLRVAGEIGAAGQVTERMLVLTALNTLLAVLALRLVVGWLHWRATDGDWAGVVAPPLWALGGSALLAALLAAAVARAARRLDLSDENATLLLLGGVLLALSLAQWLQLSTLLVPLLAGVLLRNSSPRAWVWPRHFGTAGGVLALLMFVIAGSAVTAESLGVGIGLALALLAARALAKLAAVLLLAPASGLGLRQGAGLALTLVPMSGTVLVLLLDLQAQPLQGGAPALPVLLPVMLSAIAVTELLGPCAVQLGLWLAREQHPAPARMAAPAIPASPAVAATGAPAAPAAPATAAPLQAA